MSQVKSVMHVPQSLIDFAKRAYANHDEAHSFDHALQVWINACNIVIAENITMTTNEAKIFPYVMIGHDFRDHKLIARGIGMDEQAIRDFYVSEVGSDNADLILHMHDNCSWSKRKTSVPAPQSDWMRKVLQDADWREAVGEVGLQRCIDYTKTIGGIFPDRVCDHIREKLLILPNEFNFESSKVDAVELRRPLYEFLLKYDKN